MAGDDAYDQGEDKTFEDAITHIFDLDHLAESGEKGGKGDVDTVIGDADEGAAQPADQDGENDEQRERKRHRRDTREHQVMDRADVHGAESVDFLVNGHGANFRGHGRADAAGDEDGHHDGGQLFADGNPDHAADGAGQATFD